jgi:hypothetical protein
MNVEYGREPQGTGLPAILLCCLLSSVVAAGGVFVALGGNAADSGRSPGFRPTLRSLEQLANLVALRVRLADTLTVDARDGVDSVRAAWIVRGDALVGVATTVPAPAVSKTTVSPAPVFKTSLSPCIGTTNTPAPSVSASEKPKLALCSRSVADADARPGPVSNLAQPRIGRADLPVAILPSPVTAK